jgi:hypothetical protein
MSEKETMNDNHKCYCEKCLCKTEKDWCFININEWLAMFETKISSSDDGYGSCCIICCPIKFTIFSFCLPCTFYNICRNKCNKTNNKNYLC